MSKEEDNKAVVGRWFTDFWGKTCNLNVIDEIAAPDMLLKYSLHEPRKGHADIKGALVISAVQFILQLGTFLLFIKALKIKRLKIKIQLG